jgi:hypothetical protein
MCEDCKKFAESMVRSAQKGAREQPLPMHSDFQYRPPETVIAKFGFKFAHLPHAMSFTHANGRPPEEIRGSGGLDPAFSKEICYNGDSYPGHEHWYDRMIFAAKLDPSRNMSKLAHMQGFGTDERGFGPQYVYEFTAPAGTLVRSTAGAFNGEICFPETIPWAWIDKVSRADTNKGKKTYTVLYTKT